MHCLSPKFFLYSFDPIQYRGGFDTIPRTRLRCKWSQMLCNLVNFISVNWQSEVWWGRQPGGRDEKERKNGVKSEKPQRVRKRSAGGGSVTTTMDSMMSSDIRLAQSLCRRGGPGEDGVQQRGGEDESKREARNMCCPFIGAFAHAQSMSAYTCCPFRQVRSCPSVRYSVCKSFPAGHCGGFFEGQEEVTMAMLRQKQFVAVFYKFIVSYSNTCFRKRKSATVSRFYSYETWLHVI